MKNDVNGFEIFCREKDKLNFFRALVKHCLYKALHNDFNFEPKINSNDEITYLKDIIRLQEDSFSLFFFRGHENISWEISPSLIRNLNAFNGKGLYLDIDSICELYNERGYSNSLISKYIKFFKGCPIKNSTIIDYHFFAWMQHAVSYSPLVDFTSDYMIALSFAIKANNPSTFLYDDSSVYILELPGDYNVCKDINRINKIITKMHIVVLKSRIKPGTTSNLKDVEGNTHIIDFSSYSKIVDELVPNFIIIDIPTNDCMIRQRGKFILFYDYVSVGGKMFLVLGNKFSFIRHKILAKDKVALLEWLDKNAPDIKNSYLMNPYAIFND